MSARCPKDGNTWDEHYQIGYAKGVEDERAEIAKKVRDYAEDVLYDGDRDRARPGYLEVLELADQIADPPEDGQT